jgi:hypothetical protein
MSSLEIDSMAAASGTQITIPNTAGIAMKDSISQAVWVRSDETQTYTSTPTHNGISIDSLGIGISPHSPNSNILLTWMLNFESNENVGWIVQNNHVIQDLGFSWQSWFVIATNNYDFDNNSTPYNICLRALVPAISTDWRIYTPAVRSTNDSTNYTVALNRTLGSTGAASYEQMICTGLALEML